jgi:hypothetical protein
MGKNGEKIFDVKIRRYIQGGFENKIKSSFAAAGRSEFKHYSPSLVIEMETVSLNFFEDQMIV